MASSFGKIFRAAAAAGAIATVMSAHDANAAPPDIFLPPADIPNAVPQRGVALPAAPQGKLSGPSGQGLYMVFGDVTAPVPGHRAFCDRLPAECAFRAGEATVYKLTDKKRKAIEKVNVDANREINPRTDLDVHGQVDVWNYTVYLSDGKLYGDCEDYALHKMKQLEKIGVPRSSMSIVAVRQTNGEGHAVLAVHTGAGDLILDNITDNVLSPAQTGYIFHKALSFNNHGEWRTVRIEAPQLEMPQQQPSAPQAKGGRTDPIGNLIDTLGR